MRTTRSRSVEAEQSVDLDPLQVAEDVIKLSRSLGSYFYVCNDGKILSVPCSKVGRKTIVSLYMKDFKSKSISDLNPDEIDEEVRTPLIEEVVKTIRDHTDTLLSEASKIVKNTDKRFDITYYKFVYDAYLGEMMIPIGEVTGAFFRLEGKLKIKEKIDDDKGVEDMPKKAKKMDEMMSKWRRNIHEEIGPKLERYRALIDTYDIGRMPDDSKDWREYTIIGSIVIEIPVASEGLVTAISLGREALSDK